MNNRRHWLAFKLVTLVSFTVLALGGVEIYRQAPPIPDRVVSSDGKVIWTDEQIRNGQNIW